MRTEVVIKKNNKLNFTKYIITLNKCLNYKLFYLFMSDVLTYVNA